MIKKNKAAALYHSLNPKTNFFKLDSDSQRKWEWAVENFLKEYVDNVQN